MDNVCAHDKHKDHTTTERINKCVCIIDHSSHLPSLPIIVHLRGLCLDVITVKMGCTDLMDTTGLPAQFRPFTNGISNGETVSHDRKLCAHARMYVHTRVVEYASDLALAAQQSLAPDSAQLMIWIQCPYVRACACVHE